MLQVITEHLLTGYNLNDITSMSDCMLEEIYGECHEMGTEFDMNSDGQPYDNPWEPIILVLETELRKRNLIGD